MSEKLRPTAIITAHISADYDALASMVAAGKLYPDALLVMPPYREKSGGNSFVDDIPQTFNFFAPKDLDLSGVMLLVLVDTRQMSRITHVAEVLKNPGLQIHCYDHHPDSEEDVRANLSVVEPWGSCTALLTEHIQSRNIALSTDEATMLGLGIYTDTGAFTFSSTTEHDLRATAWLKTQNMDISTIAETLSTPLSSAQVQVLNRMIESAVTHEVSGLRIIISEVVLESYMDDFSLLVMQMLRMENAGAIFALAQMGDRVQLVARSHYPEKIDVSAICSAFGGGGHSYAAAASIKNKTLEETKGELLAMLFSSLAGTVTVEQRMTAPARVIEEQQTLAEAEAIMLRYGLKAAPVVATGGKYCLGIVEYQTAALAVSHKLGEQPVRDYMHAQCKTTRPEDNVYPVVETILAQRQRLVPVVNDNDEVIGVITRTDVMRMLLDDTVRIPDGSPVVGAGKTRNVRSLIQEKLPEKYGALLRIIGELGDDMGMSVYAVGGFVRDLILGWRNLDVDVSVEGDGIAFATRLAKKLGGRVRSHPMFKTAVVIFERDGEEQRIDIATARLEYYEYPGALPTVELSSINMDLARRDFTINALAIRLNYQTFGDLVDPFGAQRDMKDKNIRVLHALSFIEDPTRVLRAIRFEIRFEFRLSPQTEKLVRNCIQLGFFQKLSGARLFNELRHIFDDKNPPQCVERMDGFGILNIIHPQLKYNNTKKTLLEGSHKVLSWYHLLYLPQKPEKWRIYLLGLCYGLKYVEVSEILERLGFTERARTDFIALRELIKEQAGKLLVWGKQEERHPGELYKILMHTPLEGILHLMAQERFASLRKDFSHFLSRLWNMRLDINGDDLLARGASSGPLIGVVLKAVLEAKADGKVEGRDEQLQLAYELMDKLARLPQQELKMMISGG